MGGIDPVLLIVIAAGAAIVLVLLIAIFTMRRGKTRQDQAERLNIAFDEFLKNQMFSDAFLQQVHSKIYQEIEKYLSNVFVSFEQDLENIIGNVSQQLHATTSEKLNKELETYKGTVEDSTEYIRKMMGELEVSYKQSADRIESKLAEFSDNEKERLTKLVDRRFADIINSYLQRVLEEGIDLGSQMPYILKRLEEHKDDIKRDINEGL